MTPDSLRQPRRHVQVFGTGHRVPKGWQPIGSAVAEPFVWHVFEEELLEAPR